MKNSKKRNFRLRQIDVFASVLLSTVKCIVNNRTDALKKLLIRINKAVIVTLDRLTWA